MDKVVDEEFERLIGHAVKWARKQRGLTQKDLARDLGIKSQQLQKDESGKNRISASRLLRISLVLGEPVDNLLSEARNKLTKCKSGSPEAVADRSAAQLLAKSILEISDPQVRESLVSLVRSYQRMSQEKRKSIRAVK